MKPIFRHYGAKALLAEWIVSQMPEHEIYVEPFAGSACVFFAKAPAFIEILNDMDGEIINVFKVLRQKPSELAALIWATPYSDASAVKPLAGGALVEAAAFIAKSALVYCGNGKSSNTFALDKKTAAPHKPKPLVWRDWATRVLPAAARLKNAQITKRDGIEVIHEFRDNPDALLYIDPPYLGHEKEFRFRMESYDALVAACTGAKAKIIVSEFPTAADKWQGWRRVERQIPGRGRTGQNGKQRKSKVNTEILFFNFPDSATQSEFSL